MDAAKHHKKISNEVYTKALEIAKLKEKDIDAIAFSQAPGLAPCLIEGINFAKELSKKLNKPLVPINHCIAHLEIGGSLSKKPKDPVMLYTSGANTQVIAYASGKYRVFGETLDVGVGNFIDNFARYLGIGFPGGPEIEKLAKKGKNYIELPYKVKGMDIALSGILTNLKQKIERMDIDEDILIKNSNIKSGLGAGRSGSWKRDNQIYDLCFSMQETVFAMLVETAERAMAHTGKKELLLGGGVGCNKKVRVVCMQFAFVMRLHLDFRFFLVYILFLLLFVPQKKLASWIRLMAI